MCVRSRTLRLLDLGTGLDIGQAFGVLVGMFMLLLVFMLMLWLWLRTGGTTLIRTRQLMSVYVLKKVPAAKDERGRLDEGPRAGETKHGRGALTIYHPHPHRHTVPTPTEHSLCNALPV
jgi:hypothetical protein